MKENKMKNIPQMRGLPDYERQRLERLKQNAEFMAAKGHGGLATQIYDKSQAFATSLDAVNTWKNEYFVSDEDEEYTPEHEGNEGQNGYRNIKGNTNVPFTRSGLGSMADFVKQPPQKKRRPDVAKADKQMSQCQATKSGSMAAFIKNGSHQHVGQPREQLIEKQLGEQPSKTSKLDHHTALNSMRKVHPESQQIGSSQPEQSLQSQKKQQQKAFCRPGSLSAFRNLRKKQSTNVPCDNEIENLSTYQGVYDCQLTPTCGTEAPLDIEPEQDNHQLNESQPRNESPKDAAEIVVHENESQPRNESPKNAAEIKMQKRRGPTKLVNAHARTREERPYLVLNQFGQPIGPTSEITSEFTRFLGTVAKNSELAPLNFVDWPSVPTHDKIWDYVQEKYIIPEEGRKWVLSTVNHAWKIHKCRIKQKYFKPFDTNEERMRDPPKTIPISHFQDLLEYWELEATKEESQANQRNRQLLDDMHTMGPHSYAMLRHKLQQEDPNKQEPSQAKVYKESRARNPKKTYKTSFVKTNNNIEQMEALESQEKEGSPNPTDPYYEVIKKPEHNGRVRLFGKGVTKTDLKKNAKKSDYIIPEEFVQSIQAALVQQLQVANPGLNLVVPEFSFACIPRDITSSDKSHEPTGEQSSAGTPTPNQVLENQLD